jgi:acetyl esterase/lipase
MMTGKRWIKFFLAALMVALTGCGLDVENEPGDGEVLPCISADGNRFDPPGKSYRIIKDITYDDATGVELKGDLYLPLPSFNRPALLFIHGGGWNIGSKGVINSRGWGTHFACRGTAVFDINYRMYPDAMMKDEVRDCRCALRWLKDKGRHYGVDFRRVGVTGGSAGGHLTSLLALTSRLSDRNEPGYEAQCSHVAPGGDRVAAAVPFYGVNDFVRMMQYVDWTFNVFNNLLGIPENQPIPDDILRKYSPAEYAQDANCPFLFIHGTADELVPLDQSTSLNEKLLAVGVKSRVVIVENGTHGFDALPGSPSWNVAEKEFDAFVEEVLRP